MVLNKIYLWKADRTFKHTTTHKRHIPAGTKCFYNSEARLCKIALNENVVATFLQGIFTVTPVQFHYE